jgi:excisionase family DNA binding protein
MVRETEDARVGTPSMTTPDGNSPISIRERLAAFDRALTAEEVAGFLKVDRRTINRHAREGIMPSFRIGTAVRFDPQKLCEWLDRHTIDPYPTSRRRKGRA